MNGVIFDVLIMALFFALIVFAIAVWRAPDRPSRILNPETLLHKDLPPADPEAVQGQARRGKQP